MSMKERLRQRAPTVLLSAALTLAGTFLVQWLVEKNKANSPVGATSPGSAGFPSAQDKRDPVARLPSSARPGVSATDMTSHTRAARAAIEKFATEEDADSVANFRHGQAQELLGLLNRRLAGAALGFPTEHGPEAAVNAVSEYALGVADTMRRLGS